MNASKQLTKATASVVRMAAIAVAVVALAAGCASSPSPGPVLLSLPPAATGAAPATGAADAAAPKLLAIRRVSIPEYLVARRVRFRADASTLAEWPNTYWAERIEIGVSREFVSVLRAQLPGWAVCDTTCDDQAPTLTLQVDLAPMDYLRSTQTLQARARVTVSSAGVSPRVLQTREWNYAVKAGADTAQAQAQAISELLTRVATAAAPLVSAAKP